VSPSGGETGTDTTNSRSVGSVVGMKEKLKTAPHRTPLFQQMALKDAEVLKETLEQKKKRLEEIRALHKPLEKQELMEHALNYEKVRAEKLLAVKEKRRAVV